MSECFLTQVCHLPNGDFFPITVIPSTFISWNCSVRKNHSLHFPIYSVIYVGIGSFFLNPTGYNPLLLLMPLLCLSRFRHQAPFQAGFCAPFACPRLSDHCPSLWPHAPLQAHLVLPVTEPGLSCFPQEGWCFCCRRWCLEIKVWPWLVWLSGLSAGLQTRGSTV